MMEFEERCFRDKFYKFRKRLKEIRDLNRRIDRLIKKRDKVPIVKDKVKSSMAEFPYTETHVTVDARDPLKTTTIERMIWKLQREIDAYNAEILEVEEYISNIPDTITRQAFRSVFIDGKSELKTGQDLGYSQARISQLINAEFRRAMKD